MYKTRQSNVLLKFFELHRQESFSAEQLFLLSEIAQSMAKSTLYRLIENLVKDGELCRLVSPDTRKVVYQRVEKQTCTQHLHMRCCICGELFHVDNTTSQQIMESLKTTMNFYVDFSKNVLLGKCTICSE